LVAARLFIAAIWKKYMVWPLKAEETDGDTPDIMGDITPDGVRSWQFARSGTGG
jgi:hypothetical protein